MVFLPCGCKSREWLDICHAALKKTAASEPVLRYSDTNFRCSPTSPGVLLQLIAGRMEPKSFFEIVQTSSEFLFIFTRKVVPGSTSPMFGPLPPA